MARLLEGGISVKDNYFDFREVCRVLGVSDRIAIEMAKQTIKNIRKRIHDNELNLTEDQYYNTYRMGMDKELNAFLGDYRLEPIAHLFRLESNQKIGRGDTPHMLNTYYTFVLFKKHYDYYKKNGKAPNVNYAGRIPKYDTKRRSLVEFQGGGNTKIPINATWLRFKTGIENFNKTNGTKHTLPEMLLVALDEYMSVRTPIFPRTKTKISEDDIVLTDTTQLNVPIDASLGNDLRAFVQRYNALNTPKTSIRELVPKAIRQFLDRMPLLYVAPDLYAEEQALKQKEAEIMG